MDKYKGRDGEYIVIKEMDYDHLENAIRYFKKRRNDLASGDPVLTRKHRKGGLGKNKDEASILLLISVLIARLQTELDKRDQQSSKLT